jgi:hemolysin activation/secretion protein
VRTVAAQSLRIAAFVVLACLFFAIRGGAQILIPGDRPGDEQIELPDYQSPRERVPVLPPYQPRSRPEGEGLPGDTRVLVREVRIIGNTVIEPAALEAIVADYEGRELAFTDLARLRDAVTRAYVDRGFVTSGAILPDQTIRGGVLELRVVEGTLEDIEIETDGRFREHYFRSRLAREQGRPVNVFELEKKLQLLQRDPRLERVKAKILPTEKRGVSILSLSVEEAPRYRVGAEFNNTRNPTIGSLGGQISASIENTLGIGDAIHARYEVSEGLDQVEILASVPLTRYDTLLTFRYQGSWADVIDDDFNVLDIDSKSESFGFELRQPLFRDLSTSVEVFARAERRSAESRLGLLGIGLPVPGAADGKTDVSVLRLGFEVLHTTRNQVLSVRTVASWGIGALGSTVNYDDAPDSRFLAGLIQLQWARRLPWFGAELVARYDMQITADPLLTLEQFAIGGRYTVRGYRENQLVRDNGLIGSAEIRVPIYARAQPRFRIDLIPFFDVGHSWNEDRPEFGQKTLVSAGLGARAFVTEWGYGELFWGHRFRDVTRFGQRDAQDDGIHFRIAATWP